MMAMSSPCSLTEALTGERAAFEAEKKGHYELYERQQKVIHCKQATLDVFERDLNESESYRAPVTMNHLLSPLALCPPPPGAEGDAGFSPPAERGVDREDESREQPGEEGSR